MLLSVPGAKSADGLPAMVTRPSLVGCLYCRMLGGVEPTQAPVLPGPVTSASHTLRARPSQYHGILRLAVAMQLTRLMATRMGYLDVSFRRSVSPARCRMSTT